MNRHYIDRTAGIRDDFDLKSRYRYWNTRLFGGELTDVPLGWTRSKTIGGRVVARALILNRELYKRTGQADITVRKLELSDFMKMDQDRADAILIHEMIHVWVMTKLGLNERPGGHGANFYAKLREMKSNSGLDIPVTEQIDVLEVSDDVEAKTVGVALIEHHNGKKYCQVMSKGYFLAIRSDIKRDFDRNNYPWSALVMSDNKNLLKYKQQRKFGRTWYGIEQSLVNSIMNYGETIEERTAEPERKVAGRKG